MMSDRQGFDEKSKEKCVGITDIVYTMTNKCSCHIAIDAFGSLTELQIKF